MIWLAMVALGNMGVTIWLVRENRRLTQMTVARHTGDFTAMVRSERSSVPSKRRADRNDETYATWRNSSEGVSP